MTLAETAHWREPGGAAAAAAIIAFLAGIEIPVREGCLSEDTLLAGVDVEAGEVVVDPRRPVYPGDLLHEAGHIAVMDPALRGSARVSADPGEEMAAIAWSVAAAQACGVALETLFHPGGYKGGSDSLIENFGQGRYFGVPLLQYWGMCGEREGDHGLALYPRMTRWLR